MNAKEAGFDGVELHGANGYLIDPSQRTDRYGGSALNRSRFLIEVTEAVSAVWGAYRVGVRLAPTNPFNDIADSNPAATFSVAVNELKRLEIGYLHIVEPLPSDPIAAGERPDIRFFRGIWPRASRNAALARARSYPLLPMTAPFSFSPIQICPSVSAAMRPSTPRSRHLLCGRREGVHRLPDAVAYRPKRAN